MTEVWNKLDEHMDWGGDKVFTAYDREVIRDVLMWYAKQVRPESTIGACPAGDPRYVWEAMIGNKFREFDYRAGKADDQV